MPLLKDFEPLKRICEGFGVGRYLCLLGRDAVSCNHVLHCKGNGVIRGRHKVEVLVGIEASHVIGPHIRACQQVQASTPPVVLGKYVLDVRLFWPSRNWPSQNLAESKHLQLHYIFFTGVCTPTLGGAETERAARPESNRQSAPSAAEITKNYEIILRCSDLSEEATATSVGDVQGRAGLGCLIFGL